MPLIWCAEKPVVAVGTRKQVIDSPVRAKTSASPAQVPSVMKIFEPEITQPSPSRSARVAMLPGSDPAPGSVSA